MLKTTQTTTLDLSEQDLGSYDLMEMLEGDDQDTSKVKKLDISYNPIDNGITYLDPERFPHLTEIDISNTLITDLSFLQDLCSLRKLTAMELEVTEITPVGKLTKLEVLNIADTKVTDLRPLKNLKTLRVINLCNTQVSDITPLVKLPDLEELYLNESCVLRREQLMPLYQARSLNILSVDEHLETLASVIVTTPSTKRTSSKSKGFFAEPSIFTTQGTESTSSKVKDSFAKPANTPSPNKQLTEFPEKTLETFTHEVFKYAEQLVQSHGELRTLIKQHPNLLDFNFRSKFNEYLSAHGNESDNNLISKTI